METANGIIEGVQDVYQRLHSDDPQISGQVVGEGLTDITVGVLTDGALSGAGKVVGKLLDGGSEAATKIATVLVGASDDVGDVRKIAQFSTSTIDEAVEYAVQHKSIHIFDNPGHNLDPLVQALGGQENTIRAVLTEANGKLPSSGIFKDIPINVNGYTVYVRGAVINGVPKLGTMFIK